jgi:hypothetical protein
MLMDGYRHRLTLSHIHIKNTFPLGWMLPQQIDDLLKKWKAVQDDLPALETRVREHTLAQVSEASETLSGDLEGSMMNVTASFDQVSNKFDEAGMWEYSFSGSSAINADFSYWCVPI